mmetsp:Transcript_7058/g.11892  ORF Transcript_7058/g.11892 Transcript_7058/m.11892 type:complete len:203 (+) Transcript_7058:60-668(+)
MTNKNTKSVETCFVHQYFHAQAFSSLNTYLPPPISVSTFRTLVSPIIIPRPPTVRGTTVIIISSTSTISRAAGTTAAAVTRGTTTTISRRTTARPRTTPIITVAITTVSSTIIPPASSVTSFIVAIATISSTSSTVVVTTTPLTSTTLTHPPRHKLHRNLTLIQLPPIRRILRPTRLLHSLKLHKRIIALHLNPHQSSIWFK